MVPEYLDQNILVYQKEAAEFINILHDASVQLIWTDPPGTRDQTGTRKNLSQVEAVELCASLADSVYRVLTPSGVLAVCLPLDATEGVADAVAKRTHMQLDGYLIDSSDLESVIVVFHRGDPRFNVAAVDPGSSDRVALITHFINMHTDPGDVVVDPFCGRGDVMEAAVRADRIAIVNDKDPDAVTDIIRRYEEHFA